ncbi:MAG: DUF3592 domain-containing protein [Anaeroplasmataceae bacterium]|nr:DUF3592 domain-containing protein [Anaeroplasmataceae bacterium]
MKQKDVKENIYNEKRQPATVFIAVSVLLFLVFVGFFCWHTIRMRNYELKYVRTQGEIVDVKQEHSSSGSNHGTNTYYFYVISYTYEGKDYTFTDRVGHQYIEQGAIGSFTEIYVNPQNPRQAEKVTSADFVSIISACFLAFSFITYTAGMNCLLSMKESNFKKRFLFVWGIEVLLGISFLLLFWLGLPRDGFAEVFVRIKGARGVAVILGIVFCATLIDGIVTYRLYSKYYKN